MAEHAAGLDKRFVVERGIEQAIGKVGAQRPADLHCSDRTPGCGAAAPVLDQFAQRHAESVLHQAAAFDVAGELEGERPF